MGAFLFRIFSVSWAGQCCWGTVQSWHVDGGVYSWVCPVSCCVFISGPALQRTGLHQCVPHDAFTYEGVAFWGWILHDTHKGIVCLRSALLLSRVIMIPVFDKDYFDPYLSKTIFNILWSWPVCRRMTLKVDPQLLLCDLLYECSEFAVFLLAS